MNRIAVIAGSHRHPSQSGKVARFIEQMIVTELDGVDSYLLDLGATPLPLWAPNMWELDALSDQNWGPVSGALAECTGVVVVTPEWGGMVPAALKNLFLLCSRNELSHKPGLIVAVSSGLNGAYPIAELRMSSYKNTQFCYIPENIIVRNVRSVFNDYNDPLTEEAYLRQRLKYALLLLVAYADALKVVRQSGVVDLATYPFGM